LDELYSHLILEVPLNAIFDGVAAIKEKLRSTGLAKLNREYTPDELDGLIDNDGITKTSLIAVAEAFLALDLSKAEEDEVTIPIDLERLKVYRLFVTGMGADPNHVYSLLSVDQQLRLAFHTDLEVAAHKKVLDKKKETIIAELKSLNSQFEKFYVDVIKVDPASGVNPITSYISTENLLTALACNLGKGTCPDAYMLHLSVIDVGGNNRTKKNLLTSIFAGDGISHSGGAIVQYILYDMTGKIHASSVCFDYVGYESAKTIRSRMQTRGTVMNNNSIVVCNPGLAPKE